MILSLKFVIENFGKIIKLNFSDYKTGFGGKFGVQSDHMDKSALSWDHHEQLNKHESQVSGSLLGFILNPSTQTHCKPH